MNRRRGRLTFVLSVVAVAGVVWVLERAGGGQLAPPPLLAPDEWGEWLAGREPVVAALAVVRLVALAAVWYLLVATVLGGLLRLCRAGRLVAVADRLTVPALRRLLVATAGVTLAAGVHPTLALAGTSQPGVAVTTSTTAPTSTTTSTTATDTSRSPPTLTMRALAPDSPPPPAATVTGPPVVSARATAEPTWTVRPGDCFWSIADEVLAKAWGRAPTDAEIVPYWRTLIEANRSALADRENPDLIFPSQVFTVPAPPAG